MTFTGVRSFLFIVCCVFACLCFRFPGMRRAAWCIVEIGVSLYYVRRAGCNPHPRVTLGYHAGRVASTGGCATLVSRIPCRVLDVVRCVSYDIGRETLSTHTTTHHPPHHNAPPGIPYPTPRVGGRLLNRIPNEDFILPARRADGGHGGKRRVIAHAGDQMGIPLPSGPA